jgi:chorismate mutase
MAEIPTADATEADATAEGGSNAPVRIPEARTRIDELDRRIIALIQERAEVSREIQQARIAAGGRRVELSREMEILERYRNGLGKPGTNLAMTMLEICRGRA